MKTAMILAAGRGERLRPLTDVLPKALCKVHGTPLIEYHVTHLSKAGYERIVINHAHLGSKIRAHLGNGARWNLEICYAPEPPGGLETGGGIANALPLLGSEPFLTINTDIFTEYDFASLVLPKTSIVHIVLVHKPVYAKTADFGLSDTNQLLNTDRQYLFSGIACYRPEIFSGTPPGRYSVTPLLRQLATMQRATGELYQGKWFDIGSQERLEWANSM